MEAVKQNNRIFRLNTWFRFKDNFYGLGTTVEPLKTGRQRIAWLAIKSNHLRCYRFHGNSFG